MSATLKRYTQIPFLIHMLETQTLTLLSPTLWDDRNDAHYIELYQHYNKFRSVLVLCMTESSRTYHHWKIFAEGTSGVFVEFLLEELISWADGHGIKHESVTYLSRSKARQDPPTAYNLPYRKRHAFKDEEEFRLIYAGKEPCGLFKSFPLNLKMIKLIELNPWLPNDVFLSLRDTIHRIPDCESLNIQQSHLLSNKEWNSLADNIEETHLD